MTLTIEQEAAMSAIRSWMMDRGTWMFYLGGYAGTGKTFLLQQLINSLDVPPHCLAPTGKAASVLQKKLEGVQVHTIHHALYKPILPDLSELEELERELQLNPDATELGEAVAEIKRKLAAQPLRFSDNSVKEIQTGDLVMIDEASMVTGKMVDDLQATGAHCLFVGDPGQLPPVGDSGFFASRQPDAILREVQRQALDNPIIRLSMDIRQGKSIRGYESPGSQVRIQPQIGYPFTELETFDQVLCGLNFTRRKVNRALRKLKGHEGVFPCRSERLICLKNRFMRGAWLINGVQALAASNAEREFGDRVMDVLYEDRLLARTVFYPYPFEAHYRSDAVEEPWASRSDLAEFDYGYAVTVHKSQGSEWDRVVLVDDEIFAQDRTFRKRWLYTAVTRARNHITWLTK